ncbi:cellulose biosynthesis protein BcsS [Altererythrobacter sp. CC-YST694]|uniref:cellulose biosynthesis protein BcsS n=1 Tax=Altererythrobacter sp. CC-YST694 TaxID=2755038 RepID=UPI001D0034F9|nr:cellulose biosynthesis protein BcsS [Altererythrobacter sp. CC-YST694]MCB5425162.1 cellulose biosynthesis protein BcsS [Altererythrobacter sp. CC-YST694]
MNIRGSILAAMPCAIPAALICAVPAHAKDDVQRLGVTAKIYDHGANITGSYTTLLSGSLKESGPLLRADVSYGSSESQSGATNERLRANVLVGYQIAGKGWKTRISAGAAYIDRTGANVGQREGAAAMFKLEAFTDRKGPVFVSGTAEYVTRDNAYRVAGRVEMRTGSVFIGPEVSRVGSDYFKSTQVGFSLSNIKAGDIRLTFRGGYSFGSEEGSDRDSPYAGIGTEFRF